jgi:FxsC-like protein
MIQFSHADLGARYVEEGFYGIMKLSKYRNQYQMATMGLARRIIEVAETRPMPYGTIRDYTLVPSAFSGYAAERPMIFTVVAPDLRHLPEGRDPYHYGRTPHEWDPFRSRNGMRPLADCAAEVARARGFLPEVGTLDDHVETLAAESPRAPGVMLVDPWATAQEACRETLRAVNRPGRQWITVVVPWNQDDQETVEQRLRLQAHLRDALGHKLAEPAAVPEVPSMEVFQSVLPEALQKATKQFFKHAPAYPPGGARVDRPRLIGPEE